MELTAPTAENPLSILHICSDYAKQKLYSELITQLAARGVEQYVYVPVRTAGEIDKNRVVGLAEVSFRFSHILRKYHRVFFRSKVNSVFNDLVSNKPVSGFSVIHAHFLYSDGAVARKIQRHHGVPYVVAVRSTDINYFMRLRPDLNSLCWDILRNAAVIVFLTPSYLELLRRRVPNDLQGILEERSQVVPNGLDAFWINESGPKDRPLGKPLRLLYVGDFSKNKNITAIMQATRLVNQQVDARLTLVGGGGKDEAVVNGMLETGEWPFVKRLGRIDNREDMRHIYRSSDIFLMPSFLETFGLAYIEALSQGVPVILSRGQGVDGYFVPGTIAEAVNPSSPTSIADAVLALSSRLPALRAKCIEAAKRFSWIQIAQTYDRIYREATERNCPAAPGSG